MEPGKRNLQKAMESIGGRNDAAGNCTAPGDAEQGEEGDIERTCKRKEKPV